MSKNKVGNGWNEYQRLVMDKLSNHDKLISDVLKQVQVSNEHLSDFKIEVLKSIDAHKTSCIIVEEFPKFNRDLEGIKTSLLNIRNKEKEIVENTRDIGDLKINVATLQVKSGIWGAIGGLVSVATVIAAIWLKSDVGAILSKFFG